MKTVCTEHMAEQIIAAICRVRERAWRTQPQRPWLEVSQPEDVLRACLEYLCGDEVDEAAIVRLDVPTVAAVRQHVRVYAVAAGASTLPHLRLEWDVGTDGQRSDLTLFFRAHQRAEHMQVLLYDVRVQ